MPANEWYVDEFADELVRRGAERERVEALRENIAAATEDYFDAYDMTPSEDTIHSVQARFFFITLDHLDSPEIDESDHLDRLFDEMEKEGTTAGTNISFVLGSMMGKPGTTGEVETVIHKTFENKYENAPTNRGDDA